MVPDYSHELEVAARVAREAGRVILEVYATSFAVTEKDRGQGPLTEADTRANELIVAALRKEFPGDSIFAEESGRRDQTSSPRRWFVDPLDGTREFVARSGEFAVHIGLAVDGAPAAGVVYAPVLDTLWAGAPGHGCTVEVGGVRRAVHVAQLSDPRDARLLVSRAHPWPQSDVLARALGITRVTAKGSMGLKCALIAQGDADLYVHHSPRSSRWDSCAPEALLRAAGGVATDLLGQPYVYDGEALNNRRGLVAGTPELVERVLPVASRLAREAGLFGPDAAQRT